MTDCPECGTQNRDEAIYCRSCGAKVQDKMYVKSRESLGAIHIGIILVAVVMIIASLGMILGGTSLRSIQYLLVDDDGFIISDPAEIDVSGYAIVLEDMEFDMDPNAWRWFQRRGGLLTFKIVTESNNPDNEIFVGVARQQDVENYLDDMEYQKILDANFDFENYDLSLRDSDFVLHPGIAPSAPPLIHSYWVTHGSSSDMQEITWEPQAGSYYMVIMNSDGSEGIEANVQVGAKVPFVGSIGNIFITAGVFFGAIGVMMIYFTLKRSKP